MDAFSNPTLDTRPCESCGSPRHGSAAHDRLERLTNDHEPVRLTRIASDNIQDFRQVEHRVTSVSDALARLELFGGPVRQLTFELDTRRVVVLVAEHFNAPDPTTAPPGNSGVDDRRAEERVGTGGHG